MQVTPTSLAASLATSIRNYLATPGIPWNLSYPIDCQWYDSEQALVATDGWTRRFRVHVTPIDYDYSSTDNSTAMTLTLPTRIRLRGALQAERTVLLMPDLSIQSV
jgi:hypothetical protein